MMQGLLIGHPQFLIQQEQSVSEIRFLFLYLHIGVDFIYLFRFFFFLAYLHIQYGSVKVIVQVPKYNVLYLHITIVKIPVLYALSNSCKHTKLGAFTEHLHCRFI